MKTRRSSPVLHVHLILHLTLLLLLEFLVHQGAARGVAHRGGSQIRLVRANSSRIIGGTDAEPGEFPHQVSVQHKGVLETRHICGGTIMTEEYVLTAASCVTLFSASSLSVVAGVNDLSNPDAQVVQVGTTIIHEHFDSDTHANDIALIKLASPLQLGDLVQPLALPPDGEEVPERTPCTVVGWGAITQSGDYHTQLQKVSLTTESDEACRKSYGAMAIKDSMMCAGLPLEDADTCDGDEGGPLLCLGNLHGVTSFGMGCLNPYYPRVFSEVAYFRNWILMYILTP